MSGGGSNANPRWSNGNARRKAAKRFAAMGAPCGICNGRRGSIRYDEPRDWEHPLSLVIDEVAPISRWREFGYSSKRECATDASNWRPAHRICNAERGDGRMRAMKPRRAKDEPSGAF